MLPYQPARALRSYIRSMPFDPTPDYMYTAQSGSLTLPVTKEGCTSTAALGVIYFIWMVET